jgi:hypothetical protein
METCALAEASKRIVLQVPGTQTTRGLEKSPRNKNPLSGAAPFCFHQLLSQLGPRNKLACVPGPDPLRTSSPNPSPHPTPFPTLQQSTIATTPIYHVLITPDIRSAFPSSSLPGITSSPALVWHRAGICRAIPLFIFPPSSNTMRLRHQRAPALLLLLPALGAFAASIKSDLDDTQVVRAALPELSAVSSLNPSPTPASKATKDAPVDGLDGKPHEGPYIDDKPSVPKKTLGGVEELRPGATRIASTTLEKTKEQLAALGVDGEGVMDDPDRESPKGKTGTEGGVSAKDKERKDKEDKSGEKAEKVPESPKEALPIPHGQETLLDEADAELAQSKVLGAQGLEVSPEHCPSRRQLTRLETDRPPRIAPRYPSPRPTISPQRRSLRHLPKNALRHRLNARCGRSKRSHPAVPLLHPLLYHDHLLRNR